MDNIPPCLLYKREYRRKVKRLRNLTSSFMRGWLVGGAIYFFICLIAGKGFEYSITFYVITVITGFICVCIVYLIIKFLFWREYKKRAN